MTTTQGDLAELSRYIFRAPRWYTSLVFAVVVAAITGIGVFETGDPEQIYYGLYFVGKDAWEGIFFVGVPTVVAAFGTSAVDRWFGGRLTPNRSSLLALVCEVVVVAILALAGIVAKLTVLGQNFVFDALLVALASIFAFRLLVVIAVSRHRIHVAAIPAMIQTATSALLLFVYSGTLTFLADPGPLASRFLSRPNEANLPFPAISPGDFVLLALLCGLYALGVVLFIKTIDQPWQRSLDVSMLDFLAGFIGHIAEGTDELEAFFEDLGEEALVPVTVLSFRRTDGTEKARFVLPMIHPGPMGEIGGGNLPKRVATTADGLAFPPHATAGHDFNLVTEREVDTILAAADRANDAIEYTDRASASVRVQEGDAKLLGQAFGDDLLLVSTFSPEFADDVDYAVGLSATAEARSSGFEDVLLVDAHNCNNGLQGEDLGHVVPGSTRSFDMMQSAGVAGAGLADAPQETFTLGTAWDETDWEPEDGIGPLGVRVGVVDVGGQTTAYVLVDGNNMEPGLRERICERVREHVDETEVMTTDTHIVNRVESSNQVGEALDDDRLIELIDDLVVEALADREPVEAGMASERAEVTVFGNDRTETLASHANAVVTVGGALAIAVTLVVMAISVLIFLLT